MLYFNYLLLLCKVKWVVFLPDGAMGWAEVGDCDISCFFIFRNSTTLIKC